MKLIVIFLGADAPMHWSIAGLIIGLIVPTLLLIGNKAFGVSSTLMHMCRVVLPKDKGLFNYDLKPHYWSLLFILGIGLGGFLAHLYHPNIKLDLGEKTELFLNENSVVNDGGLYPSNLYNTNNKKGLVLLIIGGLLIGFGTRYANGCTSGHSIFGMANLQLTSLIATIAFFAGGLLMTYLILPAIL